MNSTTLPDTVAARAVFFICGFLTASWAPLVPYAKSRLLLDDSSLGLFLLCLGAGSLASMPISAALVSRWGCRKIIIISIIITCIALPLLAFVPSKWMLAINLLIFGAALGVLDVAQNIHALEVQRQYNKPMISGLHALFSIGGFAGAAGVSLMLSYGLTPLQATIVPVVLSIFILIAKGNKLLKGGGAPGGRFFVLPYGPVLLISLLTFILFLAEGAMLDWSAVFLANRGMEKSSTGYGYSVFAIAMTLGRLQGDKLIARFGSNLVLKIGCLCAVLGFGIAILLPFAWAGLAGFALIGAGASNIIPILFSAAGAQKLMPVHLAIAAVSFFGYSGILAGPALIGFIAGFSSLTWAFGLLGLLMFAPFIAAPWLKKSA